MGFSGLLGAAFFPVQAKPNSLLDRQGTATRRQMCHSGPTLEACWRDPGLLASCRLSAG
jgi:hypothetical protein